MVNAIVMRLKRKREQLLQRITMGQLLASLDFVWMRYVRSSSMPDDRISYFERGTEHVEIRRRKTPDGVVLILSGDAALRAYPFHHLASLLLFQSDVEAWLVQTGWSLAACEPKRRLRWIGHSSQACRSDVRIGPNGRTHDQAAARSWRCRR